MCAVSRATLEVGGLEDQVPGTAELLSVGRQIQVDIYLTQFSQIHRKNTLESGFKYFVHVGR